LTRKKPMPSAPRQRPRWIRCGAPEPASARERTCVCISLPSDRGVACCRWLRFVLTRLLSLCRRTAALPAAVGYASCSLASSHVGLHRRRPISQRARLPSNKRRLGNRQFLILEEVPAVGSPHLCVRDLSFMVARANLHP
jgi:hypothetical protein